MRNTMLLLTALALSLPVAASRPAAAESAKLARVVTFEPGGQRISPKSRAEVRQVVRTLRATCPSAKLTLEGHAFIAHDEEASIALGQARADTVRDLIIKSGFDAGSVTAISLARNTLADGNGRFVDLIIDCNR